MESVESGQKSSFEKPQKLQFNVSSAVEQDVEAALKHIDQCVLLCVFL